MVERKDLGSWLEGPGGRRAPAQGWPGQRLGLPQEGPGSVAGLGRRVAALLLDWVACLLVARAFLPGLAGFGPLLVLLGEQAVLVATARSGFGHRVLGMRLERVDGGAPLPWQALVRAVLLVLAVPPLVWDADHRGLHDKAAGTVLVRAGAGRGRAATGPSPDQG